MLNLYYFAPHLKSVDWAAWVQAVGSVVAILVAAYLAGRQHQLTEQRLREDRAERRQRQRFAALQYLHGTCVTLDKLANVQGSETIHSGPSLLPDMLALLEDLRILVSPQELSDLSPVEMRKLLMSRAAVAPVIARLQSYVSEPDGRAVARHHAVQEAKGAAKYVRSTLDFFESEGPQRGD